MKAELMTVISKITNSKPGLTKGKKYKVIEYGFSMTHGPWYEIKNDRKELISIVNANKYLKLVSPVKRKKK